MPTVSARVPKYLFFKPRGLAYVRIRGHVRYLGKYDSPESREAYRRLLAELETIPAAVVATPPPKRPAFTVLELCAAYLDFAEGYYVKGGRPTDQMNTVRRAIRVVKELYGATPAAEFGPLALRAVQEHMVNNPGVNPATGKQRSYNRETINSTCGCICRMFRWGASLELFPATVYAALKTVRGLHKGRTTAPESEPILPVPAEVVERTLPHLPPVVADMVRFQRFTGARPGEVCELRPIDIDRTGKVWQYRPASHKTEHHGRGRVVFIGPKAQAVLLPYLLRPADAYCFSPAESETARHAEMRARRKTPVQPSHQTRRKARPKRSPATSYTENAYYRGIKKAIAKANRKNREDAARQGIEPQPIPNWFPNQLRHSAATEIRRMFGLEAAQTVLGHAKADVTQVYAERDYSLAALVMAKIG
jgi:integrase